MIEPVPGITVDPETKTLEILGQAMAVGVLFHSPARPARPRSERRGRLPPAVLDYFLDRNPRFLEGIEPAKQEAIHATLLCGENGWWVELTLFLEDSTAIAAPCGERFDPCLTAAEVYMLWVQTCQRRDAPKLGKYEEPFGGLKPGTWEWDM